ncbi:hypothetical protein B0H19DRAFT_1333697 [Mycena capillaripes]|nr:hypothetical protein B0H19DRAFT_1333697 [Mycena capillaripes]
MNAYAHPRGIVQWLGYPKICLRLCTLPYVVSGAAILGIVVFTVFLSHPHPELHRRLPNSTPPTRAGDSYMAGHSRCDPSVIARAEVDALLARQSSTPERAARRQLRTGRKPPLYYADWYRFARERRCMIDEYDQIHRDFKPFYHLLKNPTSATPSAYVPPLHNKHIKRDTLHAEKLEKYPNGLGVGGSVRIILTSNCRQDAGFGSAQAASVKGGWATTPNGSLTQCAPAASVQGLRGDLPRARLTLYTEIQLENPIDLDATMNKSL